MSWMTPRRLVAPHLQIARQPFFRGVWVESGIRINAKIASASFGVDGRMRTFITQIPQRAWGCVAPTVR